MTRLYDDSPRGRLALQNLGSLRTDLLSAEERGVGIGMPLIERGGEKFLLANLVLQGGGTLGIALLGFIRGLENIGIRFAGLAGTSAGSIVALLMTCVRKDAFETPVAEKLLSALTVMPAASFLDGPYLYRRLIKSFLKRRSFDFGELVLPALSALQRLIRCYGLFKGYSFESWLSRELERLGDIETIDELRRVLRRLHSNLLNAFGIADPPVRTDDGDADRLLSITAMAMPIGEKIVFPLNIDLFDPRYARYSPAIMARASMSIPLFFEPYELRLDDIRWKAYVGEKYEKYYAQSYVEEASALEAMFFLDGGLLSNFPIDAFATQLYRAAGRRIPTIGVALTGVDKSRGAPEPGSMSAFRQYVVKAISSIRYSRDREAVRYVRLAQQVSGGASRPNIAFIDTGDHNWLNFNLSERDMEDLYLLGLERSVAFIEQILHP